MVRFIKAYNVRPAVEKLKVILRWYYFPNSRIFPYIDITVQDILCWPIPSHPFPPEYTFWILSFLWDYHLIFISYIFKSLENSNGINIYILHPFFWVEIVVFKTVLQILLLLVKEGDRQSRHPFMLPFCPDNNKVEAGELPVTSISSSLLIL